MSSEPLPDIIRDLPTARTQGLSKKTVALPPNGPHDGFGEQEYLKGIRKLIDDRLSFLGEYLQGEIPVGETREGITHTTWDRRSTKWKEAYALIYRDLLDVKGRQKADAVVKAQTSSSTYDRFTDEEDQP